MELHKTVLMLTVAVLVGACSTPAIQPAGSVSSSGGDYTIVQNGETISTSGTNIVLVSGDLSWNNDNVRAYVLDTDDFVAAAIVDRTANNQTYAGISGAPSLIPVSGSASFTGRYRILRITPETGGVPFGFWGPQISNVNFGTGIIVGSGGTDGFAYSATINGTDITGTMTFSGGGNITAPLVGGFYGYAALAGAFSGPTITGYFSGINDAAP